MLLIVTSSTSARAAVSYDFVSGDLRYKINDDGKTVTLVKYDGDKPSGELVIPATVTDEGNSYSVTAIGIRAFLNCYSLTSVTIPEGVTSIGEDAFFGVRHIINKSNCTDGRPWGARVENGTVDGDFVYEDDTKAKLLVYIGKGGDITIPESVTAIGDKAFINCTSLTSVTIPESVTSIGESAFSYCTSLTSVTIPKSVISIGEGAFGACSRLTSVTIPESVTSIGNSAFEYCYSLTSVTIPENVTSIGESAFSACESLTSVTIPEGVTFIGDEAFRDVRHIINKSKCTVGRPWGARVENGTVDGDFVYEDDTKTNLLVYIGKGGEVTIPESVTAIGKSAFDVCTSLTSVTIPENVTSIGEGAFGAVKHIINKSGCTDPNHVHWGALAENGTVDGDFVYENDTKTNLLVYIGKGGEVTIPEGVTSIGNEAFLNCTSLTSVTIPEGVTSIGDYAFIGCSSLTSVTIPESVTSIGEAAFSECTSLTSITIPEGVTSIGDYAFIGCSSVENVYLYANPDNLTWSENGGDDFITNPKGATKCHVPVEYFTNYTTKFKDKVNVTFVGDVIQLTADNITTSQISDVTYTGTPFTPEIEVKYGNKTLEAGTDYTITYSNNINIGTAKATITGIKLLAFTKEVEFTILPVPVTVAAENKTKTFGESDPEFTAKIEGLVNNESPDLIKYTFSRTEGENVGEYTITPKGDEKQGNYVVRFVDGKLTINENPNTPVSSIDNNGNNVKVWSYAHTIYIASTPDSQYKIIDLQGRTIATSSTTSSLEQININKSGILVVIINGKSYKVSL